MTLATLTPADLCDIREYIAIAQTELLEQAKVAEKRNPRSGLADVLRKHASRAADLREQLRLKVKQ